jgi:hypothetical protein
MITPSEPIARASRRLLRNAVALARARLRATGGGRLGVAAAIGVTVIYGGMMIVLRVEDGAGSALDGPLRAAGAALAWAAAGPIALAAARDRVAADRSDGVEALAAARGVPPRALHGVRAVAAMREITGVIAIPSAALAIGAALLSGSIASALRHLAVGAGVVAFAAVCGATLGLLASISGRVAGRRGRTLLAAIVLIPWAIADLAGSAAWSVPGALGAFLSFAAGAAGGMS